jgi:beta-lactamase class A
VSPSGVEERLASAFQAARVQGFLHAVDVDGDAEVGHSGDEPVVLASVFKIPILLELFRQASRDEIDLVEQVTVPPGGRTLGPTGLSVMRDEIRLSWRDLALLMMSVSDNAATDVVLRRVGLERVNATLRSLGLSRTVLTGDCATILAELREDLGLAEGEAVPEIDVEELGSCRSLDAGRTSRSTPRETAALLRLIWRDEAAPPAACAEMRRIMYAQVWPHRLGSAFGDGFRRGAKTGTLPGIRNEAGVVECPDGRRWAVAVFTRAPTTRRHLPAADAVIGTAARIAIDHLGGI